MTGLVQQQTPDLVRSITAGFNIGQTLRKNELADAAAAQKAIRESELMALKKMASTGDPNAARELSVADPAAYKGLQDYQSHRVQTGGRMAQAILNAPAPQRPQLYKQAIVDYKREFGEAPQISNEYSPEAEARLRFIVTQAREVEDVAKERYDANKPESPTARATLGGGATGALAQRYMESTGASFPQALAAVQGLARKGLEYDDQGRIVSQRGFVGSQEDVERGKSKGKEIGKEEGVALASLRSQESKMPGVTKVVQQLRELSKKATFTLAGRAKDKSLKELGLPMSEGGIARAKYMALVDNQILPLLRDTFGAAFTVEEGKSLRATLGDPDMSPGQKTSVLDAFIAQKFENVSSLKRQLGIDEGASSLPNQTVIPRQTPRYQEGATATGPNGAKMIFKGGSWQNL